MKWLVAGISALALASGGAYAQGNGNGKGNGNGGKPAQAQNNKGNGGGNGAKANRGNGNAKADRGGPAMRADNGNRGNGNGNADRGPQMRSPVDRGNGNGNGNAMANRGNNGNGNGNAGNGNRDVIRYDDRRGNDTRVVYDDRDYRSGSRYIQRTSDWGVMEGCPPGLAKKYNGCNPPGQVKDRYDRYARYQPDWWGLTGLSGRNYAYDDGYLVRYDGNRIGSWLPLLGGALSVGNVWPDRYRYDRLPDYYSSYYGLGNPNQYRYANNVVYRVDPETAAITSIAALLTGDDIRVGQPMPMGYDVYNVPYAYRDRYYDTPQSQYRYSDGYVYQVDPTTRLVQAAIELLI